MDNSYRAQFVTEPIVTCIGGMGLYDAGIDQMLEWVKSRAPRCIPPEREAHGNAGLFPHLGKSDTGQPLTANELLVELAGRTCYNSYGASAGRKSNRDYIAHTQAGDVPHASILYHAKFSFFIAGVSRRVSHELIRNYVGADRDEEGAPSQQSTRYVENPGHYVIPPRYLDPESSEGWTDGYSPREQFEKQMHINYRAYRELIDDEIKMFKYRSPEREAPKGMDYKRILEAASGLLSHSVETSWVWTTNPAALAKLFRERDHDSADREFRRLAQKWKALCLRLAPNLFPQLWMQSA